MKAELVGQLRRVKQLHADRAEAEQRLRQAALNAAAAAVEGARAGLARWREEMPNRQDSIYAEVMGRTVERGALDDVRTRLAQLRDHERVLEQRLAEAETAAQAARRALDAAVAATAQARRVVSKFDELTDTLRRAAVLESERKEDAELEEVAETLHRPGRADDGEDADGWDAAA